MYIYLGGSIMNEKSYLQQVASELESNHPDNIPNSLLCFFSQDIIKDPVITPNGRVYSNLAIRKWLKEHDKDPFRAPLTESELRPFPKLEPLINQFKESRRRFKKTKMNLQAEASRVDEDASSVPDIFKCSITGELMDKAFITSDGQLIDESQVEHIHPMQAVEFKSFNQYLNYYLDNHTPQKQSPTSEAAPSSSHSFLSSIYTFFGLSDEANTKEHDAVSETEHNPKQRM